MRREVPLLLTFLFGAFAVLSNFILWEPWRTAAESVNNWALIVIAFTTVLGVGNVLRLHGLKIARREQGWAYSAATLLGLLVMVFFGIVLWFLPQQEARITVRFRALNDVNVQDAVGLGAPAGSGDLFDVRVDPRLVSDANGDGSAQGGDEISYGLALTYSGAQPLTDAVLSIRYDPAALEPVLPMLSNQREIDAGPTAAAAEIGAIRRTPSGLEWTVGTMPGSAFGAMGAGNGQSSVYTWFYDAVYVPMQSTMYALLAFFISSAAFRAFRVRSTHAVLLGVTAILVILGSVPVGEAVWSGFPEFVTWIMNDLQTAGKRAILIGAALGAIATGMKMVVGAERSYLSGDSMASGWIEKLEGVDRRVIFLIMGIAITLPLLFPVPLPIQTTKPVQDFHDFVEKLPRGARVLVADDWDPGSKAELQTVSLIVHRHLRDRGLRVIDVCLWQTGPSAVADVLEEIYGKAGKKYGEDYIFLGFKEGREVVMASMGNSIPATYPADSRGTPLNQFPIMQGVRNISSLAAMISVSAGYPGTKEWVQQVQRRYNVAMASACNGVSAPEYSAYYESKQLHGLVGGMKAFAEYEALIGGKTGFATMAMTSQAAGHYMLVLLIVLGNVLYLLKRGWKTTAFALAAGIVLFYAWAIWCVHAATGGMA